jgi:hypothetical protein
MTNIASNWVATVRWLQSKHPESVTEHTRGLIGQRLQYRQLLVPSPTFWANKPMALHLSTLIRGDFKPANLFFAEKDDSSGVENRLPSRWRLWTFNIRELASDQKTWRTSYFPMLEDTTSTMK